MKITRRQLLKTGFFATAASIIPRSLFSETTSVEEFEKRTKCSQQ